MPGRTAACEQLERAPDEQAGGAHAGELLGRLALAAVTVEQTHAAKPYRRTAAPPHPAPPRGTPGSRAARSKCRVRCRTSACGLSTVVGPVAAAGQAMRRVDGSTARAACAKRVRVHRRRMPRCWSSAHSS